MTQPKPMKVESSGWIHDIPPQPAENQAAMVPIAIGIGAALIPLFGDEPHYGGALVILAIVVVSVILVSLCFGGTRRKVNICPECNVRTTYNPEQKFCGRCGYRPERT